MKMQQNSLFPGCNFSNRDITDTRSGWSLCPVQDTDAVLTNRYGGNLNVDDTFSLFCSDLYLSQVKGALRDTMLVHESVFESQINELHRLYRRQKELMMEMEGTRHHRASFLNSGFPIPRSHWMGSSISAYQTRNLSHEADIAYQMEAELLVENKVEKFEKKVLDLELPVFEYNDMDEEVHEAPNFLKQQSLRRMSLDSGQQFSKLQLDLNEPAKIEEHSDIVFNQFLSPLTSNEIGEQSDTKNEGESSVKGSNGTNEAQRSVKCREEYGIDLNMSPLSSEEETIVVNKFETEKHQESSSGLVHGKHSSEQPRVIVQALPCSTSTLVLDKRYKLLMRGSRSRKKVKLFPSNKTFKGSDHDSHLSAQASSESQSNQTSMEKGSSSSLSEAKSAKKRTNLGKKRRCKPQMKSSKGQKVVAKKSGRMKRKKSRKISLVREGNYQEVSAAEAIVHMSRKSSQETTDTSTSLGRNLLWFAEISASVAEDYEISFLEAMKLQQREKKLEEHKTHKKEAAVANIVLGKQRRSRARQGKQKCKDDQHNAKLSISTFSEREANEDQQVLGKLIEASELKWHCGFLKNKRKSSPSNPLDAFTFSGEEKTGVHWGALKKRRRSSRIPAADFTHMIINQVV
ncbi:hypothetical protein CARUB_v10000460mg [Capsella rubella]|uniref:Uncharacterized protein n=1 Tax=Capsella rubella TaxID=81985 RepID=R0FDD8_9BRAS|nr:uncharacterized protein LOC17881269 [Capsella rubella]XP_006287269.1 uncharacterized protein LOC17881269 [Capsella rubella]XP_023637728.1 uncharacterized protein LOC17881269 [Capsella rubella]EOA20166.1 hypothetical protein CARUB_v10000460mg [Capsella rubella]EOA20167.1 hypothetical protein CARUB_v10000460mg [Capsella rubella]